MRAAVDHAARKREIVAKSMSLFARMGYRDVSFREISGQCGFSRTVLYRYFRDKRQIFNCAISMMIERIALKHAEIVGSKAPAAQKLRQICTVVTATLFDNRDFLCVIIDYVIERRRANHDMTKRIKRFTLGLKRVVHTLLTWGVRHGEFRKTAKTETVTDLLYAQFESAMLRITVSGGAVQADVLDGIDEILKGIEV